MNPEILVPLLMGCALLWWIGKGMTWPTRIAVIAVTLAIVVGVVLFERPSR